jgi:TolA-binding protein
MLTPRKALTQKKKIKEDKLVTGLFSAWDRVKGYTRNIVYAVGGLAAVILVVVLVRQSKESSRQEAKRHLARADQAWQNKKTDEALVAYQEIVDNYGKNDITARACLSIGNLYFAQGKLAEAEQFYTQVLEKYSHELMVPSAAGGLAACWENKQEYQKAAEQYEKTAQAYARSHLVPEYLMAAARCYRQLKDYPAAERCYAAVVSEFEKTDYGREAQTQLKVVKSLAYK